MARFKILNKFTEWLLPTDDNTIYFVEGDATTPSKIKVGDTTFAEANPTINGMSLSEYLASLEARIASLEG